MHSFFSTHLTFEASLIHLAGIFSCIQSQPQPVCAGHRCEPLYYIPPCVPLLLQALASTTRGRYAIETLLLFPPTSSYFTTLHSVAGSPSEAATALLVPRLAAAALVALGGRARCRCFSRQTAIAKKPGLQIIYLRKDDVVSSVLVVKQAIILKFPWDRNP